MSVGQHNFWSPAHPHYGSLTTPNPNPNPNPNPKPNPDTNPTPTPTPSQIAPPNAPASAPVSGFAHFQRTICSHVALQLELGPG